MDLRRLEIFCKVVDCRSFTRAAEEVRLSQPSVSEHVRTLEESLGVKLLDRLGREVLPTAAGRILHRYARRLLQLRAEAMQAIDHYRGTPSGHLPVGASTIPGAYLLPARIEAFRRSCPDVRVTLKIAGSARIAQEVLQGELELGLVGAAPKDPRLEAQEMFADELVLAVHPDHPWAGRESVRPGELVDQDFILREPGSGTRSVVTAALTAAGVDPSDLRPVAEVGSTEAVRQSIKAGLGISILSRQAVAEDLESGNLVRVPVPELGLTRPFYLVRRKGREASPLAAAFLESLQGEK